MTTIVRAYEPTRAVRAFWQSEARRRYFKTAAGKVSFFVVALLILVAIIGPSFTVNPNHVDVFHILHPPNAKHWFGTDEIGRDIFARAIVGLRVSLIVSLAATAASLLIGMLIGSVIGFRGGWLDDIASRIVDMMITFPTLLLGIIIAVAAGPSITTVVVALVIGEIPLYVRLFRAGAISAKSMEYVMGATAVGLRQTRIIARHVVPNTIVPAIVVAAGRVGKLAITEASLSYLGAGVKQPNASLGNMISEGQPYLQVDWWFPVIPGAILVVLSLAFAFMGDALRDAFDVRESVQDARVST